VWLCRLLWAHVPAIFAFALAEGNSVSHASLESGFIATPALAASWLSTRNRRVSSSVLAFGLLTCSAVITHLSGGYVEAHFHFFVVVTLLVLYEDWLPFLLAITYVLVHHGVGGVLMPESMFNHPEGIADPWKWAAIHAGFIAALSVGSIVSWRMNEDCRADARLAHEGTERALESARVSGERFRNAFEHAPIGMALVGLDGRWLKVNSALCSLTGYSEHDLLERTFQDITHPDDVEADLRNANDLLAGEIGSYEMEKRYITASGHTVWVLLSGSLVRDSHGEPMHFVAQILDITDRKHSEAELRYLADHDALTGLWNRRRFEEELHAELARGKRYGHTAVLLLIDLDGFKQINDTHGHKAGDEALRHAARAMNSRVRSTDFVGRLGGDEFGVLMPHVSAEELDDVATSLQAAIHAAPLAFCGAEIHVGASVGATLLPVDELDSVDGAMLRADMDMYGSKAAKSLDSTSGRVSD
jgi:diguanylate cyclase (GGDEF)-like protein/PAS domain S-box-containing protein